MRSKSSLVLGRFYPPHAGHHFLIDVAAQNSDLVTVLVSGNEAEVISLADRMSWISSEHTHQRNVQVIGAVDNVKTDLDDPTIWDQHMVIFNRALAAHTAHHPIDTVFSSEEYGDEMSLRLGVEHVLVDQSRETFPISATLIKSDPLKYASWLSPVVKAGLSKRVIVVGAESSGTTTLSKDLAALYQNEPLTTDTQWVPEFGHTYCENKLRAARGLARWRGVVLPEMGDLTWDDSEFLMIAKEQNRTEDDAALLSGLLLIGDTDAWTTSIWQDRYMGHVTKEVVAEARSDKTLYIVTHHEEVPFVQDGTRDGEHLRQAMTSAFIKSLEKRGSRYLVVTGTHQERLMQAKKAVDSLLTWSW